MHRDLSYKSTCPVFVWKEVYSQRLGVASNISKWRQKRGSLHLDPEENFRYSFILSYYLHPQTWNTFWHPFRVVLITFTIQPVWWIIFCFLFYAACVHARYLSSNHWIIIAVLWEEACFISTIGLFHLYIYHLNATLGCLATVKVSNFLPFVSRSNLVPFRVL